ncbi:MAG: sodium-translocating pyrophosphatase [Candidatus Bipolaricaulota bacterium]|nr:sodium-translocating pyrophosphatase [Candidatus Bipolaricaulota bacterium]MBS3791870.1 sodium-translocating pyrophosphatase [Candidatus Bipolaricaulota bacterium]
MLSTYDLSLVPGIVAALGLVLAWYLVRYVTKQDQGTEEIKDLQGYIREGAWTFMSEEVRIFAVVMLAIAGLLWGLFYWEVAIAFIIGAVLSMTAAFIGMNSATLSNGRTTNAARNNFQKALNIAISGGAVMGLAVAGLALGGLVLVITIFRGSFNPATLQIQTKSIPVISQLLGRDVNLIKGALIVSAYSMGASLVALFDRVGGGIYTKAADMGADLVGKVEQGLPEDDPRNPASVADNVGDNVGDVGGLGADLLESFIGSIISVIIIMLYVFVGQGVEGTVAPSLQRMLGNFGLSVGLSTSQYWWSIFAPMLIVAAGIFSSIIGVQYIRMSNREEGMQTTLMNGTRIAALLTAVFAFVITWISPMNFAPFWAVLTGALVGIVIGYISEYYTSAEYNPVQRIAEMNDSGTAVGITSGMAVGMLSTFIPALAIALAVMITYWLAGLMGVAYGALGMLSFVAITVSVDTYGPIADNAGGIAEGAGLDESVRERTDKLDSIGNTTAAIGKGFAIGSAAFSALALIAAYMWSAIGTAEAVKVPTIEILSSEPGIGGSVVAALFLGAMIPYVFSSLLIRGVSDTAGTMVREVRRQFEEMPGILKGETKPDYNKCISITSAGGLRRMVVPSLLAVFMPIIVGLVLGRLALAGFLIGALLSCLQLAIYCANTGGALDNAKKFIEEGNFGGKNSEAHDASVVGDTVGDPLKDTVGPSLDILAKLMSVVSILFASLFPVYPIIF